MKILLSKIALFISVILCSAIFSRILQSFIPGGNDDTNAILINSIFIIGEIAVCTSIIIDKLNEIRKEKTRD